MDVAVVRTTLDPNNCDDDAAGHSGGPCGQVAGQASIREDVDNEESAAEGMKRR